MANTTPTKRKRKAPACQTSIGFEGVHPELQRLLAATSSMREKFLLYFLWGNGSFTTDELCKRYNLLTNNQAQYSFRLNQRLIPLGWVITKYPTGFMGKRPLSWRWRLERVEFALQKNIRNDLRRTIHRYMEGATHE